MIGLKGLEGLKGAQNLDVLSQEKERFAPKLQKLSEWKAQQNVEQQWLIKGYMPKNGITLMSGHSKRGKKTWLADLTALTVASGRTLMEGWAPEGLPENGATVIYLEEEGTGPVNKMRLNALQNAYGLPDPMADNILYGFHQCARLDDGSWVGLIKDWVLEHEPALVIFDALTYMHQGDPNSEKDMGRVTSALREIRTLGTSVLALMHLNGAQGEDPKADIDAQFRGSKIFVNVYDSHLALRKYSGADAAPVALICRQKGAEQTEKAVRWRFDHFPDGTLCTAMGELLDRAEDMGNFLVLLDEGKGYTMSALRIRWPGRSDAERQKIIDALIEDGDLALMNGQYYRIKKDLQNKTDGDQNKGQTQ